MNRVVILKELHALLRSRQGATTSQELNDDYAQVTGSTIPFQNFEFQKLEDFLESEPNFIKCTVKRRKLMLKAVKQESKTHIQEYFASQRRAKTESDDLFLKRANLGCNAASAIGDASSAAAKEAIAWMPETVSVRNLPETENPSEIVKRVFGIVMKYDQGRGYSSTSIEEKYSEEFQEKLPVDWWSLAISVTTVLNFNRIDENTLSVSLNRHGKNPSPLQTNQSRKPIPAQFPDGEIFTVHILVIFDLDLVAVQITNRDQYREWEDMRVAMETHYTKLESYLKPVKKLDADKLYVARIDKIWVRVQLDQNSLVLFGKVLVILVDNADRKLVSVSDVFEIVPNFCVVPCQGLKLRLFGLSCMKESKATAGAATNSAIRRLLDKQLTAKAIQRDAEVSALLYDSDGNNINELILTDVLDRLPPLTYHRGLSQVKLSFVLSNGDVFVTADSSQQRILDASMSMVTVQADRLPSVPLAELNPAAGEIYLVHSAINGWRRATLGIGPAPYGTIFVHLIDLGDSESVPVANFRSLPFSPVLQRMPEQAIEVRMAGVPPSPNLVFTDDAAQRLREIAPLNSKLLMRVVSRVDDPITVVKLFKRMDQNNVLVTLNTPMQNELHLYQQMNLAVD